MCKNVTYDTIRYDIAWLVKPKVFSKSKLLLTFNENRITASVTIIFDFRFTQCSWKCILGTLVIVEESTNFFLRSIS